MNAGILVFTSSLVALNISTYNAEQKCIRDFIAARSFLHKDFPKESQAVGIHNLIAYFYRIAEIQVLINRSFDFDRNKGKINTSPHDADEYLGAIRSSGLWPCDYEGLTEFIERTVARKNKNDDV